MSDKTLPLYIDPVKHADQEVVLEGVIDLLELPRVAELVLEKNSSVQVKLEFGRDEQGARILRGKLECVLALPCERCMGKVMQTVHSEFELGIVFNDEQAKSLSRQYEPLLVKDDMILSDLLDEELLLSLPMYAYHDQDECQVDTDYLKNNSVESNENTDDKPNPFSVLSSFKFKK